MARSRGLITSIAARAAGPDRHRRTLAGVLVALAVIVPGTMVAASPQPTVTKAGRAVATGSASEVDAGGEVDWTVDIADLDDRPVRSVLTDTIGPGHELVPGSVRTPPGWGLNYSDQATGDDFSGSGGSSTRRVRATSTIEQPSSLLGAVTPVGQNVPTFTRGDGWVPILVGARVFNVYHHTGNDKPEVNCTLRSNGTTCPGYPQEIFVERANDLFTPFSAASFVDSSGRLWFSGTQDRPGPQDVGGFVCFDTTTDSPCPTRWFPTTQNLETGTAYVARSPFSGVAVNGTKVFAMAVHPVTGPDANKIDLVCFDTASLATCGTAAMNTTGLPGWENAAYAEGRSPVLQMRQVGTRFFMLVDYGANPGRYAGLGNRLLCADLTTQSPCAGWTVPAVPGTTDGGGLRFSNLLFPDLNDPGKICVGNTFVNLSFFGPNTSRPITCFNSTGAGAAAPAGFQAAVNAVPLDIATFDGPRSFAALAYVTAEVGTRMFVPFSTPVDAPVAGINTWALCFDFATGARCSNFADAGIRTFPTINNGRLTLYGFTADENGCLWGLGDAGWQVSFNSSGAPGPCSRTSARVSVRPQSFYCGPNPPQFGWGRATLLDVDLQKVQSYTVSVVTPDGRPVPGFTDLPGLDGVAPGAVDLSTLPPGDGYRFDAKVVVTDEAAVRTTSRFQVTFVGPPAQICLRTRVVGGCNAPENVRNDVEAVLDDGTGPGTSSTFAQMAVLTDRNCRTTTTSTSSTSTSSTSTSSTSTSSTSTTVPDTSTSSTTTSSTTTSSTTAPPPSVLPTTTINTSTTAPPTPPTAPPPSVQGEQVTRGSGGALAFTGSGTAALLTMAVLLLCAGLALMGPRRRED